MNALEQAKSALEESKRQIEYLHGKFQETGTGNAVLAQIDAALSALSSAETAEPYGYAVESSDGHITFFKGEPKGLTGPKWQGLMTVHALFTKAETQSDAALSMQANMAEDLKEFRASLQGLKYIDRDPVKNKDVHNNAIDEAIWLLNNRIERTSISSSVAAPQQAAQPAPAGMTDELPPLPEAWGVMYSKSSANHELDRDGYTAHQMRGYAIDALLARSNAPQPEAEKLDCHQAESGLYCPSPCAVCDDVKRYIDIEDAALRSAREIMRVVNGSWIPGGAPQIEDRIRRIVKDALQRFEPVQPEATQPIPTDCQSKPGEWSQCQMRAIEAYEAMQPPRQSAQPAPIVTDFRDQRLSAQPAPMPVAWKPVTCGANTTPIDADLVGCGKPITSPEDVYRCTDCEVPFHRECAVKHFATDTPEHAAKVFDEQLRRLDAALPLPAQQVAEQKDAERWRALLGSARIRPLGSAGLTDNVSPYGGPWDGYAHLGMELWTVYGSSLNDEQRERLAKENILGREWLTKYADIAAAMTAGGQET